MVIETSRFDIAEHLDTEDDIREFLSEAAASGDASDFIHALSTAARARGMTAIAKQAGVTRASLYKSLSETGQPRFETIYKITRALGCKLAVV